MKKIHLSVIAQYRRVFVNFIFCLVSGATNRFPFVALLRNSGKEVVIKSDLDLYLYSRGLEDVRFGEGVEEVSFTFNGLRFTFENAVSNGDIGAAFCDYSDLYVENRTVLDIGANIGDTAVYFVAAGASRVIAIEPSNSNFLIAKANISSNHMEDKVIILHGALSSVGGSTRINDFSNVNTLVAPDSTQGKFEVELFTIPDLISRYSLMDAILKMDCEGCEYDSLMSATNDCLRKFKQIKIEYHAYRGIRNGRLLLTTKLKNAGFNVLGRGSRKFGYIIANRN